MGACPRCQFVNSDRAVVCGRCAEDLFAFESIVQSAPLPAPMVEPIDTPLKPPPDSKPLPSRLALKASLKDSPESANLDPDACDLDFDPPAVIDFPTMASDQPPGYVVDTMKDAPGAADENVEESQQQFARGGTLPDFPRFCGYAMNDAALQSPAPVTAPSTETGDQSATPVPPVVPPKLLVLRGLKINVEYPIYEGKNTIGRFADKPVDIDLLNQESVEQIWCSRQHAVVTLAKGILVIEDLNSLNGTWVNGSRVHTGQQRQLKAGDVVQIGTVQMKLVIG